VTVCCDFYDRLYDRLFAAFCHFSLRVGLQGCKNRSTPFPGQMSKKVTKPGSVCHILACFYCVVSRVVFIGKVNQGDEMEWP